MTWFLILLGVLLLGFGVFVAMSGEMKAEKAAPKAPPAKGGNEQGAWDVITQPLPDPGELIQIPDRRHWYQVGRFGQGVAVGLGSGLLVAALAVAITPGKAVTAGADDTPPPAAAEPANGSGGQQAEAPAPQPTPEPEPTPAPAPAQEYTFEVEMGELPHDIAEKLVTIGLVPSEEAFLNRLVELDLDHLLKTGTFTIPSDATIDQVIVILTN